MGRLRQFLRRHILWLPCLSPPHSRPPQPPAPFFGLPRERRHKNVFRWSLRPAAMTLLAHPLYSSQLLFDKPPLCYSPDSCCTIRLFSPFPHFSHRLCNSITAPCREIIVLCSPIPRYPNMTPCTSGCFMHLLVYTPTKSSVLYDSHTHCGPPPFQLLYMIFQLFDHPLPLLGHPLSLSASVLC